MKITKGPHVKYIEPNNLAYYESQGWSSSDSKEKIVLKPVKKAAQPKPAVDESEDKLFDEIKEEVGDDNIDKGE